MRVPRLRPIIAAWALATAATAAHAQFAFGPVHRADSMERCTSAAEPGCEGGVVRTTWPVAIPGTCGRPAFLRELLPPGIRGRTVVDIAVDATGVVTGAKVVVSSGAGVLDSALLAATKTCRFQPGTRGGVPAALATSWAYVWEQTPTPPQMTRVLPPPVSAPRPAASAASVAEGDKP